MQTRRPTPPAANPRRRPGPGGRRGVIVKVTRQSCSTFGFAERLFGNGSPPSSMARPTVVHHPWHGPWLPPRSVAADHRCDRPQRPTRLSRWGAGEEAGRSPGQLKEQRPDRCGNRRSSLDVHFCLSPSGATTLVLAVLWSAGRSTAPDVDAAFRCPDCPQQGASFSMVAWAPACSRSISVSASVAIWLSHSAEANGAGATFGSPTNLPRQVYGQTSESSRTI